LTLHLRRATQTERDPLVRAERLEGVGATDAWELRVHPPTICVAVRSGSARSSRKVVECLLGYEQLGVTEDSPHLAIYAPPSEKVEVQ
jgi:hypothetical protein